MKERYKKYLKINIIPIIFIATSFIFTTFAWFAYSGLKSVFTAIDVKAILNFLNQVRLLQMILL